MIHVAQLEMHPLDTIDRIPALKNEWGSGYCNITKCCTEVCPEHIKITDNGIIPLKERVVDRFYDPVTWFLYKLTGGPKRPSAPVGPPAKTTPPGDLRSSSKPPEAK
jgi:succinate dehydrogenase / fumarate reductase iron-sulfur subunit